MEKGYNEIQEMMQMIEMEMIHEQIIRAREHSKNDLLGREKPQLSEQKLTFNITYYPAFQNVNYNWRTTYFVNS